MKRKGKSRSLEFSYWGETIRVGGKCFTFSVWSGSSRLGPVLLDLFFFFFQFVLTLVVLYEGGDIFSRVTSEMDLLLSGLIQSQPPCCFLSWWTAQPSKVPLIPTTKSWMVAPHPVGGGGARVAEQQRQQDGQVTGWGRERKGGGAFHQT